MSAELVLALLTVALGLLLAIAWAWGLTVVDRRDAGRDRRDQAEYSHPDRPGPEL